MRCDSAQELFSEYCEGGIQEALRVPLESHLSTCDRCHDEVEALRHVWKVLDAAPVVEAPAGFRAAVWQRIDAQETAKAGKSWAQKIIPDWKAAFGRRPLAWAAAAVLLLAVASFVVPGEYSPAGLLLGRFKADTGAQFGAARPQIDSGGRISIPLYLTNGDGKVHTGAVPIQVRVLSGPVKLAAESSSLTYRGPDPIVIQLIPAPDAPRTDVILEARRLDGGQPSTQILTIPLPAR